MEKAEFFDAYGKLVERENKNGEKYLSFIPDKLPPEIKFDEDLIMKTIETESALSKLSGVGLAFHSPEILVIPQLFKESIYTSKIEGTRISLDEYYLTKIQENKEKELDEQEVSNYLDAIEFALKEIEEKPITIELIKETHKILMDSVRGEDKQPGKFRNIQNWIGLKNSNINDAKFIPPPPKEVKRLMDDMLGYMNTYQKIPFLIKCALMHYQFETIHPFCDGNGRIGRALIILYLIKKNRISKPLLDISYFFEKNKSEYFRLLSEASKKGNFKDWIMFFLEDIRTQSENASEKIISLYELREEYKKLSQSKIKTSAITELIDRLFLNPYITIKESREITKSTYPTAKRYVETLVSLGILKLSEKAKRNKIYESSKILKIIMGDD